MKFKEGKIVDRFFVEKGGKKIEIILRFPKKGDAKGMVKYFNKVVKETRFLAAYRKITLKKEEEWLADSLKWSKKGEMVHLIIVANGVIAGGSTLRKFNFDSQRHIGSFGIAILQEFTKLGVGSRLARKVLELGKSIGIEIVKSGFFATNKPSAKLHKRLGFRVIGKVPKARKQDGSYDDEILVYKILK